MPRAFILDGAEIKICCRCKEVKVTSAFNKDASRSDGLHSKCKGCREEYRQSEASKETRRRYAQSLRGKETKRRFRQNLKSRLSHSISYAIQRSLQGNKNGSHWEDLVGYTLQDLIQHLEALFTDDMTWGNYAEWQIDHIIPITAFNFTSAIDSDFKRCWALNNLQPLWGADNRRKHNTINGGFQPSLIN